MKQPLRYYTPKATERITACFAALRPALPKKADEFFSNEDRIRTPGMRLSMDRLIQIGWVVELTPPNLTIGDAINGEWPKRFYRITDAGRSAGCTVGPRSTRA